MRKAYSFLATVASRDGLPEGPEDFASRVLFWTKGVECGLCGFIDLGWGFALRLRFCDCGVYCSLRGGGDGFADLADCVGADYPRVPDGDP